MLILLHGKGRVAMWLFDRRCKLSGDSFLKSKNDWMTVEPVRSSHKDYQ